MRQIKFLSDGTDYGGFYIDAATGQQVTPSAIEQLTSQAYDQSGGGGLFADFANQFVPSVGRNVGVGGSADQIASQLTASGWRPTNIGGGDELGTALTLGVIGGMGAAPLWAGSAGLGGAEAGLSAETGAGESGMWDWLDELDSVRPWDSNPSPFDLGDVYSGGGFSMPPAVPESPEQLKEWGLSETSPGVWEQPSIGGSLPSWLPNGLNAARSLLGGSLAPTQGGSILNQIGNDPLGSAFNMTPFLLSLVEANRQSGDLNNVIGKINGEGYQRAVLNPYDMDTGLGRTSLMNDLDLRGVSGSSFGYQSLGNYDYLRALGRGDLASKANLASAGLEGNLINQRNTNRNLLLGAGLNASGKMFSPQQDPFNLRALLGG